MARGGHGDPNRGLSVWYLATCLTEELAVGDEDTVIDIEPRIRRRCERSICPRDGRLGAAFVDVAKDPYAGEAGYMLSYTWSYRFFDIISALESFCCRKVVDPKDVLFWICCFCVNQCRVMEMQQKGQKVPFEDFRDTFSNRVKHIQNVVALLTPWDEPANLKRLWCVFEIHFAIQTPGCNLYITLPDREWISFTKEFSVDASCWRVHQLWWTKFSQVMVQDAEASYEDDRENILRIVAPGVAIDDRAALSRACDGHNNLIIYKLRNWLSSNVLDQMDRALACPDLKLSSSQINPIGRLLLLIGKYAEAMRVFDAGLSRVDPNDEFGIAETYVSVGVCHHRWASTVDAAQQQEHYSNAIRAAEEALMRFENCGARDMPQYCTALTLRAVTHQNCHRVDEALLDLSHALSRLEAIGKLCSPESAIALLWQGACFAKQDRDKEAMAAYEASKVTFEECNFVASPFYYELLVHMSRQHGRHNRRKEAARVLRHARSSFRSAISFTDDQVYLALRKTSSDLGFGDKTPYGTPGSALEHDQASEEKEEEEDEADKEAQDEEVDDDDEKERVRGLQQSSPGSVKSTLPLEEGEGCFSLARVWMHAKFSWGGL
eukprot:TRINITY_DN33971_c0_g1_i1.p1 TRINITY_DN33971_c0_g1~~TRINITY_DN33971_c0_g1_i1.p1  ORF type:complete len:662 (+),score=76.59 TRINITY_DN33971_c0_g1_i1:170-1987(+)